MEDAAPKSSPLSAHWLWLALLCGVLAPTLFWLLERWATTFFGSGHGVIVALIAGYLIVGNLRRHPVERPQGSAWGFVFLIPGLAMVAADTTIHTQLMAAVGLVLCIPGLSLLLLGMERTRELAFPLLLLPLMLPIPAGALQGVNLILRHVTAWGTTHLVDLLGIPILREATTLFLPTSIVEVADACSGFSTLYASITLALVLSYLAASPGRRLVLMAASVALAIGCNMIRVTVLTLIVHYYGVELLATFLHELSGMATFAVALVGLFMLADREGLRTAT